MMWIRKYFGVPAKRGGRVEFCGGNEPLFGTITSARNGRLMIMLDGAKTSMPFHPTWKLKYLNQD